MSKVPGDEAPAMSRRLRRLLVVTAALTYVLMLLGLYTGAVGAGLSCQAQWPLCDGGLFPETLPSVPEWAHRAVAGVVGLFLVGSAALARHDDADRRVQAATVGAVVATPLQYAVGAVTVTLNGLLPWGFNGLTRATHFSMALVIFGLVLAATAWARDDHGPRRIRRAVLAAAALLPFHLAFVRGVVFPTFTVPVQVGFYAASLALFAALFAATLRLRDRGATTEATLGVAAVGLLYLELVLGRGLFTFTDAVQVATYLLAVLVAAATLATAWLGRRAVRTR